MEVDTKLRIFGERLKQLRLEKGLNGVQLAEEFGVTKSAVSNWEVRDREPTLEMLVELANFFEVSVDYLIGKSDLKNSNYDTKSLAIDLIQRLIENNTIADADNIPKEIEEMIILAFKSDLKSSKKK